VIPGVTLVVRRSYTSGETREGTTMVMPEEEEKSISIKKEKGICICDIACIVRLECVVESVKFFLLSCVDLF